MSLMLVDTNEVKKHVSAIHIGGKISHLQRKLNNALLYNAYDHLINAEKHQIKIRTLCELAGFDSNNHQVLKETLISLSKIAVTWNLLGDDDVEEWGVSSMLSEAVIRKGICTYAYSPSLREKLYRPELYARINLSVMNKFSGSYSYVLYEDVVRFRGIKSTGWRDIEFWRTVLGVGKEEYRQFKELNKKILKPSIKEINEISDILLTIEYRKSGRKVDAIRFLIKENPQMPMPFPIREKLLDKAKEEAALEELYPVYPRLASFGLTETQARRTVENYAGDYIAALLDIVERHYNEGKVENLPAYTLTALKEDYRPKRTPFEAANAERKEAQKKRQEEEKRQQEEKERQHEREAEAVSKQLDEAIAAVTEEARKELEAEFVKAMEERTLPGSSVMLDLFRKSGRESLAIHSMLRNFMRERLSEGKKGVGGQ